MTSFAYIRLIDTVCIELDIRRHTHNSTVQDNLLSLRGVAPARGDSLVVGCFVRREKAMREVASHAAFLILSGRVDQEEPGFFLTPVQRFVYGR